MDPGDLNEFSEYSDCFDHLKSRLELALEQVQQCDFFFNQQNLLLSSLISDFNELVSHYFFERMRLQDIEAAFREANKLRTQAIDLIESIRHNKNLAKTRIQLATIFAEAKAVLRETIDCIESFEAMTMSLCDIANDLENNVTKIEEKLRSLKQTYYFQ
ncbi:hypothetical protein TNCV_2240381 [Trichonephila clavipes]|nr:hypothetical protein TNCV_2240381 [Trichonephila clavipes]